MKHIISPSGNLLHRAKHGLLTETLSPVCCLFSRVHQNIYRTTSLFTLAAVLYQSWPCVLSPQPQGFTAAGSHLCQTSCLACSLICAGPGLGECRRRYCMCRRLAESSLWQLQAKDSIRLCHLTTIPTEVL